MNLLQTFLDIVYPPICWTCNQKLTPEENYICSFCFKKIKINKAPLCKTCSRPAPYENFICDECLMRKSYLEQVWSLGIYDDILKKCIHLFKYKKKLFILNPFKKYLIDFFEANLIIKNIDLIVPVPIHISKLNQRTFNQSQIIANIIARNYKIKLINVLKKIKSTCPQNELTKRQRRQNVKGAYAAYSKGSISKKRILIIDDVFTTGSTLNECAKILRKAGAEVVYGFTLARGL